MGSKIKDMLTDLIIVKQETPSSKTKEEPQREDSKTIDCYMESLLPKIKLRTFDSLEDLKQMIAKEN